MEFLLSLFYALFFILLIFKSNFFTLEGISKRTITGIFIVKIAFGLGVWAVYTFYYQDRKTADIYKYFDDSKVMFDALYTEPLDFLKMFLGLEDDAVYFQKTYYSKMNYWARTFDSIVYNDSHTITRFNALLRLFSFGYYNVHTVFMCFLSLTGLTALYKFFFPVLKEQKKELAIAIFLIPSVLFWSSGVLKEGLIMFSLGMLFYKIHHLLFIERSLTTYIWIIACAILLLYVKFYIIATLIPGIIAFFWVRKTNDSGILIKYLAVFSIYLFLGLNVHYVFKDFPLLKIIASKQNDFINVAKGGTYLERNDTIAYLRPEQQDALQVRDSGRHSIKAGTPYIFWSIKEKHDTNYALAAKDTFSYNIELNLPKAESNIPIKKLKPIPASFIKSAPQALANSLLRPHLLETYSFFTLLSAIENLLIIVLIAIGLLFIKPFKAIPWNEVLLCFSFVFLLFLLIGWTTPVAGAIVRYKVPAIPFLIIALLLITDKQKFLRRFPVFQKILN